LCGELPVGKRAGCWTGSRYQPIPITKQADPDIALQIVERPDQFPGVDAQPISIRSYPGLVNVNAAHVLGYVGPLTEDDLTKDTGKQYFRSESIGKAGLEIQYDSYLRGIPGIRTLIVDRKEVITRESQNTKPIAGDHLVTSLDIRLQAAAEKALEDAVKRGRANGYTSDSGAAVVMDIRTGRILALASYPTYDPNAFEKNKHQIFSVRKKLFRHSTVHFKVYLHPLQHLNLSPLLPQLQPDMTLMPPITVLLKCRLVLVHFKTLIVEIRVE